MTIGDVFKETVRVKIVPDASPNADGEWAWLDVSPRYLSPKTHWDYLSSLAPRGFHVVQVSTVFR